LFTGNAPQHVIFHALEKVKDFDVLSTPVYRAKSIETSLPVLIAAPSASAAPAQVAKKNEGQSSNENASTSNNAKAAKLTAPSLNNRSSLQPKTEKATENAKSVKEPSTNGSSASATSSKPAQVNDTHVIHSI
jgi:hypothetical protein